MRNPYERLGDLARPGDDSDRTGPARVYIAGPIAGRPDGNRAAFATAEEVLRRAGFKTSNPQWIDHAHAGPCTGDEVPRAEGAEQWEEHRYGCYLRADIRALLACDFIYILPDSQMSRGATVEKAVAYICGIEVLTDATLAAMADMPADFEEIGSVQAIAMPELLIDLSEPDELPAANAGSAD